VAAAPATPPAGLALDALAAGLIAGLLLPSTPRDDEALGPVAGRVKNTARDIGAEALERGKEVGQQAAGAAMETAEQAGCEQADQLKESAKERAQQLKTG
jgi:hypothetical protein